MTSRAESSPMELGLWLDFGRPGRTLAEQLERHTRLTQLAERSGFTSVWVGESYSFDTPSPLLALAALAPNTGLQLGTGVLLLPYWQPLRLAYETAALDQLSGGRLLFGVGVGRASLQERFGVDPAIVGDWTDEVLDMLRALWRGDRGFEGRHVRVEGGIAPLPIQPGGPPIWVGGAVKRSAVRAALHGDGYYSSTTHSIPHIRRQIDHYRAALREAGKDPGDGQVAVNRLAVVSTSEARAREAALAYIAPTLHRYALNGSLGKKNRANPPDPTALFESLDREMCLVGTPDEVAERLLDYVRLGAAHVHARITPLDTPEDVASETVVLLGTEVVPRLERLVQREA